MEWQNEGIILAVKPHSESNLVIELLTSEFGRHNGLVRGGRSQKNRASLQIGNRVIATWRGRLEEHLGNYKIELTNAYSALLLDDRLSLSGVNTLCTLARMLPEREPFKGLYEASVLILDHMNDIDIWPMLLVRWELEFLHQLGFGLDLSQCAATGSKEDLIYISPKSGKAVSASAGEPYKDKLLHLPTFLQRDAVSNHQEINQDVIHGFDLTGFFLSKYIFNPRGQNIPESRARLVYYLTDKLIGNKKII